MTTLDDHGRAEPPSAADEATTLLGFLDYQRATFAWKTAGLNASELAITIASSTMNLGGMMKHLALDEDSWLSEVLTDKAPSSPWAHVDWENDPDWEWRSAANDSPEMLRNLWEESVERSRASVTEFLLDGDLGKSARRVRKDGRAPSARWILCHMIEEYARHNGHADLIREAIDGETGE
ncbi:MAG TPA: DinB family protein [Acidimicrobiales bacterium]